MLRFFLSKIRPPRPPSHYSRSIHILDMAAIIAIRALKVNIILPSDKRRSATLQVERGYWISLRPSPLPPAQEIPPDYFFFGGVAGAFLAAIAEFLFCVLALFLACFCAACLLVAFGDLSPIVARPWGLPRKLRELPSKISRAAAP